MSFCFPNACQEVGIAQKSIVARWIEQRQEQPIDGYGVLNALAYKYLLDAGWLPVALDSFPRLTVLKALDILHAFRLQGMIYCKGHWIGYSPIRVRGLAPEFENKRVLDIWTPQR